MNVVTDMVILGLSDVVLDRAFLGKYKIMQLHDFIFIFNLSIYSNRWCVN